MQDNLLKYILGRAKRTMLLPFYKYIYKLKMLGNVKVLLSKAVIYISATFKNLLTMRPEKASDYFYIGRLGIYKKLLLLLLCLICLAPVVYFEYINPVSTIAAGAVTEQKFVYNDPAVEKYSGPAVILTEDRVPVYVGAVEKGLCTGAGKLYNPDGTLVYSGDFKENMYEGTGKLYYPNGKLLYEGGFKANKYEGQGTLYNPNSTVLYTGTYLNGLKEGKGTLYNTLGTNLVYEGNFVQDLYDGEGTLYADNNIVLYKGTFKGGKYSGSGVLSDPATARKTFEGQFADGTYNGTGTLYSAVGRPLFTGNFLNGIIDYIFFMDISTSELSKYLLSRNEQLSLDMDTVISYPELNVSLFAQEPAPDAAAEPTVHSIMVYDGSLPASLKDCITPADFEKALGVSPSYQGYTYVLPKDFIPLKILVSSGTIDAKNPLYSKVLSQIDVPVSDIFPEYGVAADMKLYLVSFQTQGFTLSLFYDEKDGRFLYYSWES